MTHSLTRPTIRPNANKANKLDSAAVNMDPPVENNHLTSSVAASAAMNSHVPAAALAAASLGGGGGGGAESRFLSDDDEENLQRYKDGIRFIDLNKWLRQYGVRVPRPYLTQLWCVKDCLGIAGCVFTWILIVFGEVVFAVFILRQFHDVRWSVINGAFSFICATLGFIAHVRAMFTDPVSTRCSRASQCVISYSIVL